MTKEELLKLGIKVEDLTYPFGEMNIIVNCRAYTEDEENINKEVFPDIYQPRKNRVWSCSEHNDGLPFESKNEKEEYIKHLKDSIGRLRILALLLEKQVVEFETTGCMKTDCYYPDLDKIGYIE